MFSFLDFFFHPFPNPNFGRYKILLADPKANSLELVTNMSAAYAASGSLAEEGMK